MDQLPLEVDCRALKQRLDRGEDLLLLDCREADEWELVRLPQTRLLPMSELRQRHGELAADRGRGVVVYCHHGGRSLRVAAWLRQQGFAAQSLAGDIDQWAVEIDPSLPRY